MPCKNCNNTNICDCDCRATTTTTCYELPPAPCVTLCEDLFYSECIIYDGPDLDCYGVSNGDSLKKIFEIIITQLVGTNCSCDFGNPLIGNCSFGGGNGGSAQAYPCNFNGGGTALANPCNLNGGIVVKYSCSFNGGIGVKVLSCNFNGGIGFVVTPCSFNGGSGTIITSTTTTSTTSTSTTTSSTTTSTSTSTTSTTTAACNCTEYYNNTGSTLNGISYTDCTSGLPVVGPIDPGQGFCTLTTPGGPDAGFLIIFGSCCP